MSSRKDEFDINSLLGPAPDVEPSPPGALDVDLADYERMLAFTFEDGGMLRHQGLAPEDDHVPVAHYTSVDGTIDVWLTAKAIAKSPRGGYRGVYYGLLDLGNGHPEVGPIELFQLYVFSLNAPETRLVRDPSYRWSKDGRRVYDILGEKRRKRGR